MLHRVEPGRPPRGSSAELAGGGGLAFCLPPAWHYSWWGLSLRMYFTLGEPAGWGARGSTKTPNKRMQLTKLRAAPVWRAEVPPCAPAGKMDGGTASQLIRGVRRLSRGEE